MNDSSKYQNLVSNALRGDITAKQSLYLDTVHIVYHSCQRIMQSDEAAKDITQEAYIQAFDRLASLQHADRFAGWVKRIAINKCLQEKKNQIRFEAVENISAIEDNDNYENVDWSEIQDAISKLPASCQTIFNLYVMDEYKHKEIAEMLSISVGTSKSQLNYAKKLLREKLQSIIEK